MVYTVGEMAKKLNVAASTLRYYDKEGLLPFVERNNSGIRQFKETDYEWLLIINCLKKSGLSIKDIKSYLAWAQEGDSTIEERLQMFYAQRKAVEDELVHLMEMHDILDYKCWYYETAKKAGTTAAPKDMNIDDIPETAQKYRLKYQPLQSKVDAV